MLHLETDHRLTLQVLLTQTSVSTELQLEHSAARSGAVLILWGGVTAAKMLFLMVPTALNGESCQAPFSAIVSKGVWPFCSGWREVLPLPCQCPSSHYWIPSQVPWPWDPLGAHPCHSTAHKMQRQGTVCSRGSWRRCWVPLGQECEVCEAHSLEERSLLAMGPGQGKCFLGEQAWGFHWNSIILSSQRKG